MNPNYAILIRKANGATYMAYRFGKTANDAVAEIKLAEGEIILDVFKHVDESEWQRS